MEKYKTIKKKHKGNYFLNISLINHLLILSLPQDSNSDNVEEVCKSDSPVHSSTIGWGEDSSESGIRNALMDYVQSHGIILLLLIIIITFTNFLFICLIILFIITNSRKDFIKVILDWF